MAGRETVKTVPAVQSEPRSKGERTRERILDLTYDSVIRKGFASTSIEEIVEAAGITKSGFFYHFKDKTDLARQLIERYADENRSFLDDMSARARELSDDPLHSFLIFLKLYAEAMAEMADTHPGCLVATVTFQDMSWDHATRRMTVDNVLDWRGRFLAWLEEIAEVYPPKGKAELADLADAILAFTYGGMTLAKALQDNSAIARQALMFRETVRLHFLG
ncbi:TetR/AcrR family transcriptional regulator [Phenylobacterium sp. J367]|uniref:TetR/AcrR family transcriptional regulator n=1 Tax=Phenylobacterium sp. J367 TaxID=2898435 RepID=UPI002150B17F|nr:TetR/AcrR family transcriptional regulator [Phenylobacterium sp. J367]MCR5877230.1 TetR/AcrR family transcriptional regulator [Phenylobacterium sp. J367]